MRVNPARRLDRIEATLTDQAAREVVRRHTEGSRTRCHELLHELHAAGYAPADAFDRRMLTAYEMARSYLDADSPWRVAADQRATGRYAAPIFYASLGLDGTRCPGWAEWDDLALGWGWPKLAEVLEAHERAECCAWLFLVFVADDDGSHAVLDFHGPAPEAGAVPLVPRPGSPRLDLDGLRLRAARESAFGSGYAPFVDGGGTLHPGRPDDLARRLVSDQRVVRLGPLTDAAARELAERIIERLTREAWDGYAAHQAARACS